MAEQKQKYYLFPEAIAQWRMVYARASNPELEDVPDLDIARCISLGTNHDLTKEFEPANYVCINHGTDIREYLDNAHLYELMRDGQHEIWEIGDYVFDMDEFLIPNLYYVRHVGIIF